MKLFQQIKFSALVLLAAGFGSHQAIAEVAGTTGPSNLVIADGGRSTATVVVGPGAGEWEKRAAADLIKYIERMSGAKPALADKAETIAEAMKSTGPLFIIGQQALASAPELQAKLNKVAKQKPVLRADAIAVARNGNRVYLAGLND